MGRSGDSDSSGLKSFLYSISLILLWYEKFLLSAPLHKPISFWSEQCHNFPFSTSHLCNSPLKSYILCQTHQTFLKEIATTENYCFAGKLLLRRLVSRGHFLQFKNLIVIPPCLWFCMQCYNLAHNKHASCSSSPIVRGEPPKVGDEKLGMSPLEARKISESQKGLSED